MSREAGPALPYPTEPGTWRRLVSRRFQLSLSLPDGAAWRLDDHSQPSLVATHEETSSRLELRATQEDELVSRHKCEDRARALGWIDDGALTTVDDEVTTGPDAYDSRVRIALETRGASSELVGHVYLFGGFLRRCLLVHLTTRVPSMRDEPALSQRLAVFRARSLRGLTLEAPRVQGNADVPRVTPGQRR